MQILTSNVINFKNIKVGILNFYSNNKRVCVHLIFILFFISLYFLIDPTSQSLVAHDEGLYARRARLIESSNNWFSTPFQSPHHKTLGSYWFIALSIRFFGNSELALRLPSILSSFLCLICSYLIALKITNKKAALICLLSLSSTPLWIQYSRYASPDFPFVLCILLVIFFFLKYLDSSELIIRTFYIFLSGLFISTSFFIRSYMAFVPLIGLTPFIFYHLFRERYFFKLFFCTGIFLGSIPTLLNLYFSLQKFGITGITVLFDFARKQAIGEVVFTNLILAPLNFIYFTFPVGIILLLLVCFTKSNTKSKYPLLVYCYPLISLTLMLCMSTSYPHYYIFLLPSLSIIFATYLAGNSFRYQISRYGINCLLLTSILFISSFLIYYIINNKELVIQISHGKPLLIYILSSFILLSYFLSIRFLFDIKKFRFNLIYFLYNIIIPQYICLSLLYNFGVLGNPNYKIKRFLKEESISSIINSNTIYLYGVESKIKTLLSYYLPSSKVIDNSDEIIRHKYVIISNTNSFEQFDLKKYFIAVKKFDNNLLLMNISK